MARASVVNSGRAGSTNSMRLTPSGVHHGVVGSSVPGVCPVDLPEGVVLGSPSDRRPELWDGRAAQRIAEVFLGNRR